MEVLRMDNIIRLNATTKKGNFLSIFYNQDTGLFCADMMRADEKGGNEFVRMTINEDSMLPTDEELNSVPDE
jgi:hypothetical protein